MKIIDPPSGWRYGFPKPIPDDITDHNAWLVENGYPQSLIDELGEYFFCRYWDAPDNEVATNSSQPVKDNHALEVSHRDSPRTDDVHFGDLRNVDVDSFYKGYNKAKDYYSEALDSLVNYANQKFTEGYDKAKETLYTEEQVREAIEYCKSNRAFDYNSDEIIQSLKQPKQ